MSSSSQQFSLFLPIHAERLGCVPHLSVPVDRYESGVPDGSLSFDGIKGHQISLHEQDK